MGVLQVDAASWMTEDLHVLRRGDHPPPQAGEVPSVARRRGAPRLGENRSRSFAKKLRQTMTHAEVILWQCLRRDSMDGLRFRRQHPIGPYIADFACVPARLVVEIDGATHGSDSEVAYDARRRRYLAKRGWREIRVGNFDIYKNLSGVLEVIWREVASLRPPPSPSAPPPPFTGEDKAHGS